MIRIWTTGALATLLLGAPVMAMAADLPVKAPPLVVYDWTGFYVGGNLGYSWGRASTTQADTLSSSTTFNAFNAATGAPVTTVPGVAQTFPFTIANASVIGATNNSSSVNGIIGGLQGGYNWQVSRSWLWGLETDFQGSGERGSSTVCSVAGCAAGSAIGIANYNLRWFGTVRGRVGFLPTDTLVLYATGGLAYGQFSTDYASGIVDPNTPLASGSARSLRAGWTLGAGAEGAIDRHWSWKAEYLYMDLGSVSTTLTPGASAVTGTALLVADSRIVPTTNGSNAAVVSTRFTDNIFRFGFNYRFDPGPVIARY
jgi:outer membrane immunogenic protein